MKRLFIILIALFILLGVMAMIPSNETSKDQCIKNITYNEYVKKVFDGTKFKGSNPVIIDFYATWCGPCKKLSPIMEELSKEYAGKIDFYKVDVDKEPRLAQMYSIRSIPVLLFIKEGTAEAYSGFRNKENLKIIISKEFGL